MKEAQSEYNTRLSLHTFPYFLLGGRVGVVVDIHEVVLRETTRNHTRHAQHLILALDAQGRPYFSIGRVEDQKSKFRTKAGQAYRGTQWTDCKQMTFFIEGAKVEEYISKNFNESGIYCTPIKVFVTRDYFNRRDQGGEQ